MKLLVIAEPAARDLDAIVEYIALDNPVAAEKTYLDIVRTVGHLSAFPALGRPGRFPETRELSIPNLPYLVIYEVGEEAVTVLAVFHTSRDLVKALGDRIQHP